MAATSPMYSVKPHYQFTDNVELPKVMYNIKSPLGSNYTDDNVKAIPELVLLEKRQLNLLEKLDKMIEEVSSLNTSTVDSSSTTNEGFHFQKGVITDVVIHANPDDMPRCLKLICSFLKRKFRLLWKVHFHSSLLSPPHLDQSWANDKSTNRSSYDIAITLILKNLKGGPLAFVSPSMTVPICGESNIARLFGRILGSYDCSSVSADLTAKTDLMLDLSEVLASKLTTQASKQEALQLIERTLNGSRWLCGDQPSIADAVALSVLYKAELKNLPPKIEKWFQSGKDVSFR